MCVCGSSMRGIITTNTRATYYSLHAYTRNEILQQHNTINVYI